MTIDDLIVFAQSRLAYLNRLYSDAVLRGDVKQIESLQVEIEQTNATLTKLLDV